MIVQVSRGANLIQVTTSHIPSCYQQPNPRRSGPRSLRTDLQDYSWMSKSVGWTHHDIFTTCHLSAILPASLQTSTWDWNVKLWEVQSCLNALIAAVPSAVSPEIATPMPSSALKIFCWDEDSSEAARFSVAKTTYSLLCGWRVVTGWKFGGIE